ncbi:hypothetical protein P872_12340 [Rhodonellum psychrophilum GCM71 = DSM 17998]|uniref:Uncharacterized protein n=2 Tax=Rhodonellum TaxID=336827 RepID=U5BJE8_9BACT|nr:MULTISPECIES: hypothetical protein [Rhodonellum]ERM80555.1 hypothetical protein P872_12340 [Rhodonellum psychrophilum GCM71 = DSM 17998]
MIKHIKNLLPRIRNHSKKLDHIEIFVEKPWVLIQEPLISPLFEYEFYRDNKTLISVGGNVSWGTWSLTPSSQRLILKNFEVELLLETVFIDKSVMILKKSGTSDDFYVFMNRIEVPNLNFQEYFDMTHLNHPEVKNEHPEVKKNHDKKIELSSPENEAENKLSLDQLKISKRKLDQETKKLINLLKLISETETRKTHLTEELRKTKISISQLKDSHQHLLVHGPDSESLIFNPEENPELIQELNEVNKKQPNLNRRQIELYLTFAEKRSLPSEKIGDHQKFVEALVSAKLPTSASHRLFSSHSHLHNYKNSLKSFMENTLLQTTTNTSVETI